MKLHTTLLATALLCVPAFAGAASDEFADLPALSAKRLSGSLNVGYETNYNGRGLVMTHSVAEGDSAGFAAVKYNYDFGKKNFWSWDGALSYRDVPSGHTLYGNPDFGPSTMGAIKLYNSMQPAWAAIPSGVPMGNLPNPPFGSIVGAVTGTPLAGMTKDDLASAVAGHENGKVKQANIEPELAIVNSVKYKRQYWNMAVGHDFIHGGILGVMAKHYRDQGSSSVNEVFARPEITPAKWMSIGCTVRYSFEGICGWWFEPDVTFKAPIIGTPEDPKLVGVLSFNMSATADYFRSNYFACNNGTQAFWIKVATPWFVTKNIIITPSVSFNWLGKGALKANEKSEFRKHTENANNVPFRNFGVVGGVSATYTF